MLSSFPWVNRKTEVFSDLLTRLTLKNTKLLIKKTAMLEVLPDYESDSEDEFDLNLQKKIRKKNQFDFVKDFDFLEDAKVHLKQKGFSYDYRVKENLENNRKVSKTSLNLSKSILIQFIYTLRIFSVGFQKKDVYRCSALKYRSDSKCDSVVRIVYNDDHFSIEHNMKEHTCSQSENSCFSKPVLNENVISEIQKLFTAKVRKPKQILMSLRAVKNSSDPNLYVTEPSKNQIVYQLGKLKEKIHGKGEISLSKLEKFMEENSEVPDNEDEAFIVGYNVTYAEGDLEDNLSIVEEKSKSDKRSFWMLYSTKRLLNLATSVKLICGDTTFKFLWLGYPAILIGTVDFCKQFHPIAFGFTSVENSKTFNEAFNVSFS